MWLPVFFTPLFQERHVKYIYKRRRDIRGLCHCFHLLQEEFSGEPLGFVVGALVVGAMRVMNYTTVLSLASNCSLKTTRFAHFLLLFFSYCLLDLLTSSLEIASRYTQSCVK